MRKTFLPFMMLTVLNVATAIAQAQTAGEVGLLVGTSSYDLNGTGSDLSIGAMLAHRPMKGIILDISATYFGYTPPFGEKVSYIIPEVGVETEVKVGALRPFLGAGAGVALAVSGSSSTAVTLHAVGGLRIRVGASWNILLETRARALDPFAGSTFEFRGGLSRSIW